MSAASQRLGSAPKAPGVIQTAAASILVVLLAIALIHAPRDTPPTIAAIAPHAVQEIKKAPDQQASTVGQAAAAGRGPVGKGGGGNGSGGGGGGAPSPAAVGSPTPGGATPAPKPRTRLCKGQFHDQQIDDPQSPPCVPYFDGPNGGATAPGVTATTIRIGAPGGADPTIVNFFQQNFELYGRSIEIVATPNSGSCVPSIQQSEADQAASMNIFASLDAVGCTQAFYFQELARNHIIAVNWAENYTQAELAARAPYAWQYEMAVDRQFATMGGWICDRLPAGSTAAHAGPGSAGLTRKIGVLILPTNDHVVIDETPLTNALKACGYTPDVQHASGAYQDSTSQSVASTNNYSTVITNLKTNGDTTVVCLCEWQGGGNFARSAVQQAYFPEWLIGDFQIFAYNETMNGPESGYPASQLADTLGVSFRPRQLAVQDDPTFWAESGGPGMGNTSLWSPDLRRYPLYDTYRIMLLVASGIQMAGPNLTPQSFMDGLQKTKFPNHPSVIQAGRVGFEGGSFTMTQDYTEWWWGANAQTPYSDGGTGSICYVAGGARHAPGTFPKGPDPFFGPTCDSGGYAGQP